MTLEEKIEDLIGGLPDGFTFLHGDKAEQNLSDDMEFPISFLDVPIISTDLLHKTGAVSAKYPIAVLFAMKSEPDWTYAQHLTNCIEPMRIAARKFYTLLQNDSSIGSVANGKRTPVKNLFDVNMSGCIMTCDVTLVDANSICV